MDERRGRSRPRRAPAATSRSAACHRPGIRLAGTRATRCSRRSSTSCRRPTRSSGSSATGAVSRCRRSATSAARVIFGMRSCDARGMAYLRRMQATDLPDAAYLRRADRVAVVTLACTAPCTLGFCVCCDAGPFAARRLRRAARRPRRPLPGRGQGATGARRWSPTPPFRPATRADVSARDELERGGEASLRRRVGPSRRRDAPRVDATGRRGAVGGDEPLVLRVRRLQLHLPDLLLLLGQGPLPGRRHWERCRTWDSCQYRAFTLEASGHNPRERRNATASSGASSTS